MKARDRFVSPHCAYRRAPNESEGILADPLEGVGYGGVSPREDEVNIPLTGKDRVKALMRLQDFAVEVKMGAGAR